MKKFFKFWGKQIADVWKHFVQRTKTNIPLAIITFIFGAFCLGSAVYFIIVGRSRDVSLCICYFLVIPAFYVVEHYLKIKCPTIFGAILYVFILTGFIGACYNVYTYIPCQDNISHAVFGLFFTLLGFALMKCLIGEPKTKKKFFACLLFAVGFAYIMSVAWEFFEFAMDMTNPMYDMQEDTIVNHIHSFFLHEPYDHLNTEIIDGIAKTVLYDADGNIIYVIEGGYLDVGIIDTMCDLIWCTVGTVATCVVISISWLTGKKKVVYNSLIPAINTSNKEVKAEEVAIVEQPVQEQVQPEVMVKEAELQPDEQLEPSKPQVAQQEKLSKPIAKKTSKAKGKNN